MKHILLLVLAFLAVKVSAQNISGTVIDESQNPISYASVVAKSVEDQAILNGVLTNEEGHFTLPLLEAKDYFIEIQFVGFQPKRIDAPTQSDLGSITLTSDTNLEEVLVVGQKDIIQQKADRLVFSVENSATVSGGNLLDALKQTPGVNVTNTDVAIFGKGTVNVMINDRVVQMSGEDLVAYLGSISADDVKEIEVITAPPAKYDAEGNSGLLNIKLKQPKEGSWNNSVRAGYAQTTYPAFTYGNSFTYSDGKLNLTASYNGKQGREGELLNVQVPYENSPWFIETFFKEGKAYNNTRLGLDYEIGQNTTIGGLYAGNFSKNTDPDWGFTKIYNAANEQIAYVDNKGETKFNRKQHSANLHLIQRLDTLGRKLSVDADYFSFDQPQDRLFSSDRTGENASLFKAQINSEQNIENKSLKLDMDHPMEDLQLSYGLKYTTTETNNLVNFFDLSSGQSVLDQNQSNEFMYEENVAAAYADAGKSFGETWQAKVGLRVEKTNTTGFSKTLNQENKNEYVKAFPTAYLSNQINENNSVGLNYSRRITRPRFQELNPFRWYINQNSYAEGNPFLQPSITDNIELQHVYKGKLISKIYYNDTQGEINQILNVNEEENQLTATSENYYNGRKIGLEETLVFSPIERWNTTTQFSIYRNEGDLLEGFSQVELKEGVAYVAYTNHSFILSDKRSLSAELTGLYVSPQKDLFYSTSNFYQIDLAMSAKFLNDKLGVNASVIDLFNSAIPKVYTKTNNIEQIITNDNDQNVFKLNVAYKFGNQKIRVKQRGFGNSEEQGRSKN